MSAHHAATDTDLNMWWKWHPLKALHLLPPSEGRKWDADQRSVKIKDAKNLGDKMVKTYLNAFPNILAEILNTKMNCLITWTVNNADIFYSESFTLTDHYQILGSYVWLKKPKTSPSPSPQNPHRTNKDLACLATCFIFPLDY